MNIFRKFSRWLFEFGVHTKRTKLCIIVLLLISIGIGRTLLEVQFKVFIDKKWFSLDPDILFAMGLYPIYSYRKTTLENLDIKKRSKIEE